VVRSTKKKAMRSDGEKSTKMEHLPPIARAHLQRPANSDHLDADLLASFAERSLPPHERQQVLQHLSRCAKCREVAVLAGAEPEDALREPEPEYELVAAAAAAATPLSPAPAPQLSDMRSEPLPSTRKLWFGHPPVRWITVAACALVCATVLVRYPTLWRGKQPTAALKNSPLDSLAYNHPLNGVSDLPLRPLADVPPAEPNAARRAHSEPRATASPLPGVLPQIVESARPSVPTPESDGTTELANKSSEPNSRGPATYKRWLASPAASAPAGSKSTAKSAARVGSGGLIGGMAGGSGSAGGSAQGGGSGYALAPRVAHQSSQSVAAAAVAAAKIVQPQWTLSEDGIPQRSDDSGHTWQKFPVDTNVQFRALYADQQEVWAGGRAGILYHSIWARIGRACTLPTARPRYPPTLLASISEMRCMVTSPPRKPRSGAHRTAE